MEAVILAAGRGSRMGEMTADRPKLLLPVEGKTILEWQLEAIEPFCHTATVVLGHGFEAPIDGSLDHLTERYDVAVNAILFDDWEGYENAATCYRALQCVSEDTLILCGDVVFSERVISTIVERYTRELEPNSYSAVAAVEGIQDEMTGVRWDETGTITDYGAIPSHREIGVFILHRDSLERARRILEENRSQWFPVMFPKIPTKRIAVSASEQAEINRPADIERARDRLPF
ncbi:NTP transferase domain-containing protein [Haloferacaceae archaeon DSL9]